MYKKFCGSIFLQFLISVPVVGAQRFVELPDSAIKGIDSAYVSCNTTGEYGLSSSALPSEEANNTCAVISEDLMKSPLNSPVDGFKLVGVQVGDIEMSAEMSGKDSVVARLSEAIWRNQEKTECVLATQIEMHDAPMINGEYFEINDIAHAGFANKKVAVAYFYKSHSNEPGGNTEVLFRAGRTFTSVPTEKQKMLPSLVNDPVEPPAIATSNVAGLHTNWVDFTTDISFKDKDGVTRSISSIFYIKYPCDDRDPISVPGAIRLRSTGQSGSKSFELPVSGLIPADANVMLF